MSKLLLISLRDWQLDSDRIMPPIGIMTLKGLVDELGVTCDLTNDYDLESTERYSTYTHFGVSCMTPQRDQALQVLGHIRKHYPKTIVFIGGPHATYYTEECLKSDWDHVVVGDGEEAVRVILKDRPTQRLLDIPIRDVNYYPIPYRGAEFVNQYNFDVQGKKTTTILTAKGCPNQCAFCESAGTKVQLYSPENVGRQVDQVKALGYDGVMFFDDIFALSNRRVRELTEVIGPKDIVYRCFGHARNMTSEMVDMLAQSGCIEVGYGAETGSQKILDIVNKRTTVKQNMDMIDLCNSRGIKVKAFMMVGLPGEDKQTIHDTDVFLDYLMSKTFVNRFGHSISNDFDITVYYPFKGTPIRDNLDRYDIRVRGDFGGYFKAKHGTSDVIVSTSGLSSWEIVAAQQVLRTKHKAKLVIKG